MRKPTFKNLLSKFHRCCFILIVSSPSLFAQTKDGLLKFDNPATYKGYANFVEIDLGNSRMIILSGQVSLNEKGELVGKNNLALQTEQTFMNIRTLVEKAGGTIDNLVKIDIYLKNMGDVKKFREVRDRFINTKNPPASTLAEVSELFRDDILIEISATAVIGK